MSQAKPEAVKRPTKVSPQSIGPEADGFTPTEVPVGERALVAYLQGTVGNHAVNRLMRSYGHQPSAWLAASRQAPRSGQTLSAGVSQSRQTTPSVQRAPAAVPDHAPAPKGNRDDYIDLLNGFEDLAIAAANQGGRGLNAVHFGPDLSPAHHTLLKQIQEALDLAREHSPDSRRAASAMWPPLERKFRTALADAGKLGIPSDKLAAIADNLTAVGEKCIHLRHRGPAQAENPDDYTDLLNGIQHLLDVVQEEWVDKRDAVVPLNIQEINEKQRMELGAVQFGQHLSKRHRDLLINLRTALIYARTEVPGSARTALAIWQSIQGEMRHAFQRAPEFVNGDVGAIHQRLSQIGEQLIRGGVYSEAHNQAADTSNLAVPDQAFQEQRLKEVAEGFNVVDKLAEKGVDLTGEAIISTALSEGKLDPKLGHAIFELVKNPGEIHENWEKFKEEGVIDKSVTAAELVEKALALRNAVVKVTLEVTKRYADKALEVAVHEGETEAVKHWWAVSDWAAEHLEVLEKVEKVATVITIAVSAIKIIDALRHHKWGEALAEAGTTSAGLLATTAMKGSVTLEGEGTAVGVGGAAMVAGVVVVVAAEVEAVKGAAAMIEYCNETNVHDAASSFIDLCTDAANIEGRSLVADAKLLADPANASVRDIIEKNLLSCITYWRRHLEWLGGQLRDTMPDKLGGQPALVNALGNDARQVLQGSGPPPETWQAVADQIRIVFAGANAMAKYVADHYAKSEK